MKLRVMHLPALGPWDFIELDAEGLIFGGSRVPLELLQMLVGGTVTIGGVLRPANGTNPPNDLLCFRGISAAGYVYVVLCNEDGGPLGLPPNRHCVALTMRGVGAFVGDLVVCRTTDDGSDFIGLSDDDVAVLSHVRDRRVSP